MRVVETHTGRYELTVVVGDVQHLTTWDGMRPSIGDVFSCIERPVVTLLQQIGKADKGSWSDASDAMRWRVRNQSGRTRMETLRARHIIKRTIREYFDEQDFIEIDSPLLVRGASPDVAIDTYSVEDRYLVSSTEYQIKRMEIGGFDRLYTLTQNFRRGDTVGQYRNPEFTMLEWARVGESLARIENDVENFIWLAHRAVGGDGLILVNGARIPLQPPWPAVSVEELVFNKTGINLKSFSASLLREAVISLGISLQPSWADDAPFLFSVVMDGLQPALGIDKPLFVKQWPAFETSSAGLSGGSDITDRTELFIGGVEISDGFASLTSRDDQRTGFEFQLARRAAQGLPLVRLDEMYLDAMRHGMPSGAGMALGFDRLVMVLTGSSSIRDVLAFAWDEV